MKTIPQAGDTIVEVLISMLVVSVIMTGAFVSANRSLLGTRRSQERGEALNVIESRVETLRAFAADRDDPKQIFDPAASSEFCIAPPGDTRQSLTIPATADADPLTGYGGCSYLRPDSGNQHYFGIKRNLATNTFTFYERWLRAGGGGVEEIRIVYRFYK